MLELGVDEITIVLQLSSTLRSQITAFDWYNIAENMISRFVERAGFKAIFGEPIPEKRPPSGYTVAYTYGEHNFYLAVAYHQQYIRMGVVIKFSAQSLDYYCETSGLKAYELLQMVEDESYTVRLSRIDLTADYIDERINVTTIYQNLIDNKIGVFRENTNKKTGEVSYRGYDMQYNGILNKQDVPTLYLGSVKSNSMLRIYDKKREQMERSGSKLDKAKKCDDWVRFEGVFRHEFAHQISDELLRIKTDDEFANLIACTISQKFRLMCIENGVIDCETEYLQMLLDSITNKNFTLKSLSSKNYDIAKSFFYLFYGSGVISTLYKIKTIWGDDAISELLLYIKEYLNEWEQNDDCRYWLRKNTADYRKNYTNLDKFADLLSNLIEKYAEKLDLENLSDPPRPTED